MIEQKIKNAQPGHHRRFSIERAICIAYCIYGNRELRWHPWINWYRLVAILWSNYGTDKAAGRGMQLAKSPVKKYAVDHGLHISQPEKIKNPEFIAQLKNLHADLQIVVAFRMLPEIVWDMPPMGTINFMAPCYHNIWCRSH
jgi:hypothetical protein